MDEIIREDWLVMLIAIGWLFDSFSLDCKIRLDVFCACLGACFSISSTLYAVIRWPPKWL